MGFINLEEHLFKPKGIPQDVDVVFVADMFVDDYAGGAELTLEALIEACPFKAFKLHSRDVTLDMLQQGHQKFWIFGNFADLDKQLIPSICANMNYSIVECDYKFCRYRSIERHEENERSQCNCHNEEGGKMVSAFMYAAKSLWWMSEKQEEIYTKRFPFLKEKNSTVLSSVFNDVTFAMIKSLSNAIPISDKKGWIVCGSPSWIKGTDDAIEWCKSNGLEYEVVWNIPYSAMLEKLARAEGLVFLPKGADTCPRMVIEAKLLGCKLHLNDNVQHKDELWFDTKDQFDTEAYLYLSRDRFWNGIRADMEYRPTISGYTTTRDCITQDYPFMECIQSMLGFCDEVVVVDGGSTDGTWEKLQNLALSDARVVVHQQPRDLTVKRFAVFDGMQKALARSLCTKDFCWQQDSDEIVHEDDYQKVRDLVKHMPKSIPVLCLPVIEYWGSTDKVRIDVNVWKWRLSQNTPLITHGIPKDLRMFDSEGQLYSAPGSDGCDYVKHDTYERIGVGTFISQDVETAQRAAVTNAAVKKDFEAWFNSAISNMPSVHHYSWYNIERKIKTYKNYWSRHWESLYDIKQDDTAENNMFFDKSWADVSDVEIVELAKRLKTEMGGWVFHRKLDFSRPTNSIKCTCTQPAVMSEWLKRNS